MTTTPEDVTAELVAALIALATRCREAGRFDECEAALTRAVVLVETGDDPDPIALADLFADLARLERARGRPAAGIAWARGAVATREAVLGPGHPDLAGDLGVLDDLRRLAGRAPGAAEEV